MANDSDILFIEGKVEPAKLAGLFGINVSALYQDHQKGLFGPKPLIEQTYKEVLYNYRQGMIRSVELKLLKEQNEQALRLKKVEEKAATKKAQIASVSLEVEDTMHPLMKQKLTQEIKLNRVKEVQHWLKVAQEKNQMLNSNELAYLLSPFIQTIKSVLVSISADFPETSQRIENAMNNLAAFGEKIVQMTDKDDELFIEEMLEKDIEESIVELAFLPEE